MGAAEKIVHLDTQVRKVELTEVVRDTEHSVTDDEQAMNHLAQSLTRPQAMTDEEIEAALNAPRVSDFGAEDAAEEMDAAPEEAPAAPRKDMSKVALFASLAAVILLLGFYFHLNQNIKTLTQQVQDLSIIKTAVSSLDTKMNTMEGKVADLESLPAKTRAALMSNILQDMTQKTSYMSTQMQSEEQKEKLMKAKELIQQVQTELNTVN